MRQTDTTRTAPLGSATLYAIVRSVGAIAERFEAWRRNRETVRALRRLTPAQLDDIGLTASDVERFERGEAH